MKEKVMFTVWNHGDLCRIEANDYRTEIRKISDGACILSLDVLLAELNRIDKEMEKRGYIAVFVNEGSKK